MSFINKNYIKMNSTQKKSTKKVGGPEPKVSGREKYKAKYTCIPLIFYYFLVLLLLLFLFLVMSLFQSIILEPYIRSSP